MEKLLLKAAIVATAIGIFIMLTFVFFILFSDLIEKSIAAVLSIIGGAIGLFAVLSIFEVIREFSIKGAGLEFKSKLEEVKEEVKESKKEVKEKIADLTQSIINTQSMFVNNRMIANPNQTIVMGDVLDRVEKLTSGLKEEKIEAVIKEKSSDLKEQPHVPEEMKRSYERLIDVEKEIAVLRKLISPLASELPIQKNPESITKEADFYYYARDYIKANELYNQVLSLDPKNINAILRKSIGLIHLARLDEAKRLYEKVFAMQPKSTTYMINVAVAYLEIKSPDVALQILNEAEKNDSTNSYVYYNRACAYSLLNQKEEALKDLEKAITVNNHHKEKARQDSDFDNVKTDERFKKLVSDGLDA